MYRRVGAGAELRNVNSWSLDRLFAYYTFVLICTTIQLRTVLYYLKILISGLKISISGLKILISSLKIRIYDLKIFISGLKI